MQEKRVLIGGNKLEVARDGCRINGASGAGGKETPVLSGLLRAKEIIEGCGVSAAGMRRGDRVQNQGLGCRGSAELDSQICCRTRRQHHLAGLTSQGHSPLISLRDMGVEEVRSQNGGDRQTIAAKELANTTRTEFSLGPL